jgi:hypothetical protein
MAVPPTRTLLGLIDARGAGGAAIGAPDSWRLVVHLAAWRPLGGPVSQDERRCELPVSQGELRTLMEQVAPYQIVAVETESDTGQRLLALRRIVELHAHDDELARIAAALQQPIILDTARFSTLRYERRFGRFTGQTQWSGRPCALSLACAEPRQPEVVLTHAEALFAAEDAWRQRIEQYAVAELLAQAEDWRYDDGPAITGEQFLERMTIESIDVDEAGGFSFIFDDGDLFAGHAIQISGDLATGPTRADTPG